MAPNGITDAVAAAWSAAWVLWMAAGSCWGAAACWPGHQDLRQHGPVGGTVLLPGATDYILTVC